MDLDSPKFSQNLSQEQKAIIANQHRMIRQSIRLVILPISFVILFGIFTVFEILPKFSALFPNILHFCPFSGPFGHNVVICIISPLVTMFAIFTISHIFWPLFWLICIIRSMFFHPLAHILATFLRHFLLLFTTFSTILS